MDYRPDIVAVENDGSPAYTLAIEIKTAPVGEGTLDRLRHYMYGMGCTRGLVISPSMVWILAETPHTNGAATIIVKGRFPTPPGLVETFASAAPGSARGVETERRIYEWLERLPTEVGHLEMNEPLRAALNTEIAPLLRSSTLRAHEPEWPSVQSAS